jgi:hypothetical protein
MGNSMNAGYSQVSQFTAPQTPRTEESSRYGTPKKFASPGTMVKDLTQQLNDTTMKSPLKDGPLSTTSQNNSKRKL